MHQVLFSPPHQTLLRAINLGFLDNFPFLTADLVHKHLAKSPATAKGRLKLRPSGFHSTRRERIHHTNTNIICCAALADKQKAHSILTALDASLPVRSTANNYSLSHTIMTPTTSLLFPSHPPATTISSPRSNTHTTC